MGSLKESFLEEQEERRERLAEFLGLSFHELFSLDYTVTANISDDGHLYGYLVKFDKLNDPLAIDKITGLDKRLEVSVPTWVMERSRDDEYELGAIFDNTQYEKSFYHQIESLKTLRGICDLEPQIKEILNKQIFVGVIGALETFLSDAFINKTMCSNCYYECFVKNSPEFKKEKISVSEIFDETRKLKEKAKNVMLSTIYHKLYVVKKMYESTFSIEFPDIADIQKYVSKRHDLVHRSGKTKEGETLIISERILDSLIADVVQFVEDLSTTLRHDDIPF